MASGGRRGAGERVLESRHVIGLFLLMLVFSGVFFALGYVMGRNQYAGQVRASENGIDSTEPFVKPKPEVAPKKTAPAPSDSTDSDPATSTASDSTWSFYDKEKSSKVAPHLETPPKPSPTQSLTKQVSARNSAPPSVAPRAPVERNSSSAPPIANGAIILQVAALAKQDDALALAGSLQKKHFSAYVQAPHKDKYYRVQVGPFKDQKSAEAAKKGLESAGFKAFVVKH
ncbi:MAG TPA: SPOR domain-containing protein [Candidatus Baltobacteraceae bacterium]|jgi:cell division septation protein DedD|nr:SPOR domain-containing protein [Candidatus Baltobacteraceae bacterium]